MNPYNIDITQSNLEGPIMALNVLYNGMPATSGCEKCVEVNGDNAFWCCLAKGTLVYTDHGPIPIEEVSPETMIFTKSGLKKVLKTGKRLVKEDLVRFETRYGRQLLLTVDHKVFAGFGRYRTDSKQPISNPRFVESGDLVEKTSAQHGHYIVFPKINSSNQAPDIDISVNEYVEDVFVDRELCFASKHKLGKSVPVNLKINSDFLFILGLFLAEGSTGKGTVDFHLSCGETSLVDKIVDFADSYGLYCSHKNNRGDSCTHRICSTVMSRLFRKLCGHLCDNKKIHRKLLHSIIGFKPLLKALHDGYYAGDGSKGEHYSYTTTSYDLHAQMLFINLILGRICCSVHLTPNNKKEHWTGSYSVAPKYRDYIEKEDYYLVPIRKVSKEYYEGYVYDIEIEDEESFYTEAGEVHNCKTQNPSMYYVEFLQVFKTVGDNWSNKQKKELILRAVRNYLDNSLSKGCVFYDGGCTIYSDRPLACRLYGVISKENWDKRWETLKARQGDSFEAKPQCTLVSSDREITPDLESKWFLHVRKSEERIGIPPEVIDRHDLGGGSYRTFHDHLLLEFFGEELLAALTEARMTESTNEEIDLLIEELRKQLGDQTIPGQVS